ncbi:chromosomal replication initiator protein DnaA [Gemmatimonas aurantiaca]|nr:chromosomal replication initiator protein DnaA [Gemmatimonas aurantiaca]
MSHIPPSPSPSPSSSGSRSDLSGSSGLSGSPMFSANTTSPNANHVASQTPTQSCLEWRAALTYLSRRVKKQSFATWLFPTRGAVRTISGNERVMEVFVSNQFVAEWVRENYLTLIEEALLETSGKTFGVLFSVRTNSDRVHQTEIVFNKQASDVGNYHLRENASTVSVEGGQLSKSPISYGVNQPAKYSRNTNAHYTLTSGVNTPTLGEANIINSRLSQRYRFNGLVVGAFNEFAFAAAQAVAMRPGSTKYNPLFIYGGVGLGKTHLAQSIGQAALENNPATKVKYATSEEFTNDFIFSLSNSSTGSFANSYRSVDILLIDDIQFFSGKESTQEQFFHTFNALYNSGKQIVLTADRPPQEIKGLEARLLSRFSSGLVADIQTPDLEARVAILSKKMAEYDFNVDEESLLYIASRITTNVRELEGALTRLYARASVSRITNTNLAFTEKALSDILNSRPKRATVNSIQKAVALAFDVDCDSLKSKKRTAHLALARQAAMYLTRNLTEHSLQRIGQDFGGRDHSTVIHACSLIEAKIESNMEFKQQLDDIVEACV